MEKRAENLTKRYWKADNRTVIITLIKMSKSIVRVSGLAALIGASAAQADEPITQPPAAYSTNQETVTRSECLAKQTKQEKIVCLVKLREMREANTAKLDRKNAELDRKIEDQQTTLDNDKAALEGLKKVVQIQEGPELE